MYIHVCRTRTWWWCTHRCTQVYVGVQVYSQTVQDAYVVVYSVTDRSSFVYAQSCLVDIKRRRKTLARTTTTTMSSAVVLVANKQDQVRSRVVSESGPHRDIELISI